ncbi:MAG TPA: SAM-dependent chlorinase/fluorinase [Cryomorphaceae bacterium]|nr:SAM-dependent chlorinase/fluorinase [Cryomorphaceae bacterium]
MPIVTLTSDLSTKDYYLAAVKATAYRLIPEVRWIDISNHIPPFDMAKAAFVLKNVWKEFPKDTIHIVGVSSEWAKNTPYIIVKMMGQYFIGTDNGFFSLLFDETLEPDWIRTIRLEGDEDLSFPVKSIFVGVAAKIANADELDDFSTEVESYRRRPLPIPVVEFDNIRGMAIYVDSYGNVITNITRQLFEKEIGSKEFNIVVRRGDTDLNRISRTYNEVPQGEKVALFTSEGYLEIAINRGVEGSGGGATDLLGIRENDIIRIEILE